MPKLSRASKASARFLWADVIRIVAIYFVVQIHALLTPPTASVVQIVTKLDTTGVPLFVMLSGALLLGKQESYTTFFKKRCMKVLVPWIIWTLIYMIYYFHFHHNQMLKEFFYGRSQVSAWFHFLFHFFMSIAAFWFLPMIFGIYLLTPALRIIIDKGKKINMIYLLVLWFLSFSLLPFFLNNPLLPFWDPAVWFSPFQFIGYFVLGYVLITEKILDKARLLLLVLLSILPFVSLLLPSKFLFHNFAAAYLYPGVIISSIFFFYFLFKLSNNVDAFVNSFIRRCITVISAASFGVFFVHELFIDVSKSFMVKVLHPYHMEFLFTIIIFAVSTIFVILIKKIPIVSYIVP